MLPYKEINQINIGSGSMPWLGRKPKDKAQHLSCKLYVQALKNQYFFIRQEVGYYVHLWGIEEGSA